MMSMTRGEIERMLAWANQKLATGQEPPWAWYQYMKLRETLEAILAGMDATKVGSHLKVVGDDKPVPVQLPM